MARHAGSRGERRGDDFDLERLTESMLDLAWLLLGVAVAGILICVAVRLAGLRWSWALAPLPGAALAFLISPLHGALCAGSLMLGAGLGFGRERQDLERGGTDAQRARERRGPISSAAALVQRSRAHSSRVRDGRFVLGQRPSGAIHTVPFGQRQGTRAFIVGAPGSGKTVTLAAHATAYAGQGLPVVCVDPKGDRGFREQLRLVAERQGQRFLEWTPQGPAVYNPLASGTPSEIADKALAGEEWTEPHYLRQAQRYLGLEVQALHAAGEWPATLRSLSRYLDPRELDALSDRVEGELRERLARYTGGLGKRALAELGGVRDRLAVLEESELGRWLSPRQGEQAIDLAREMATGSLVYFQLDADRFPLASQMVGASIVVDLVSLAGQLQGKTLRGLVIVDEFAAVAAEEISRLLSRSRSAGLSVLVATQAFADLSLARPSDSTESLRRQVLSHIDYLIAHRQSEPEAAELLGQMAGTRAAWSVAHRFGGEPRRFWELRRDGTKRRTREFIRHPEEFKSLGVGQAIVIEPAGSARAERVRVWPADRASRGVSGERPGRPSAIGSRSKEPEIPFIQNGSRSD